MGTGDLNSLWHNSKLGANQMLTLTLSVNVPLLNRKILLYVVVDLFGAPPFNPNTAASPTGAGSVQSPTTHAQKQVTSPANPFAPSTGASGMYQYSGISQLNTNNIRAQKCLFLPNKTFTFIKQICGKIMFSQASVILFFGGGEVRLGTLHTSWDRPQCRLLTLSGDHWAGGTHPTPECSVAKTAV